MILTGQANTPGYELATDAQFRELSNFSTPPRAGRITAIEASGQVRVETDDPDGGDVLAWPLNGFTYAVDDVVYLAFAVNSPDSAIVIGSLGNLPLLDHAVLIPLDHGSELTGLGDDDHPQYLLLAGRSGGQVVTGLSTGEALRIYRNLAAASTDSPVLFVLQDHASDDQPAAVIRQDGSGDILQLLDGTTKVFVAGGDGAVGIGAGTTAPDPAYVVQFTPAAGHDAAVGIDATGAGTGRYAGVFLQVDGGYIQFASYGTTAAGTRHGQNLADAGEFLTVNLSRLLIGTFDNVPIFFGTNNALRMMIDAGGVILGGLTSMGASILGIKAGGSSNDAAVGGALYETRTQTGNVGAGEDDLASYSVPANTLSVDGMSVSFEASGTCAANLNTKTLRIRFGTAGTNLIVSATVTGSGGGAKWIARGRVVRTGAAAEKGYAEVTGSNITTTVDVVTGLNQTLSGAVTLKITGEATSNNDIVLETFRVEWGDANT